MGHGVVHLVQALSYKIEVRGFDDVTRFFNLPNPSGRTRALGSTQPLTETTTRDRRAGEGRPAAS
jgi:hypothetical protein